MTHDHLNDEQLSAHLDGEVDDSGSRLSAETVEAQVAGCSTCRERLAALGRARDLLGRPVAVVPSSVRTAAVETALTEGLASDGASGPGVPAPVRPLPARPARPRGLGAAAAVVALLVVGVGTAVALSHSDATSSSSGIKASSAPAVPRQPKALHSAQAPSVGAPAASLPDLGSLEPGSTLRSQIATVLPLGSKAVYGLGNGSLPGKSGIPQNSATGAATQPSAGDFNALGPVPAALAPCLAAAEDTVVTTDTLDLVATATYRGTPALVVVVTVPASGPDTASSRFALIVARTGCRILARVSL